MGLLGSLILGVVLAASLVGSPAASTTPTGKGGVRTLSDGTPPPPPK
jgi:hypothetical protein